MNIFVGLSGGVDSSVAAALLKKEGHGVHGVYLKVWSPDLEDLMHGCPWEEDVRYAEATAKYLGVPFEVWDISKEYYDKIVSYFFSEYETGRTPNPDIMCNREMKFGIFLERARERGADFIATGHYARKFKVESLKFQIYAARDANKDQSYFLYQLTQEQLKYALFPIGDYTKPEVRTMAKEWALPTADRKDSQGLCFLGKIPVRDFLKTRLPSREGTLVTTAGKVVGQHEGAQYFTIGQRHGIGSPGGGTPYFVVGKDMKTNTVTVAEGEDDPMLYKKELTLKNIHWISGEEPQLPLDCFARIRYRQPLQEAQIMPPLKIRGAEGGPSWRRPRIRGSYDEKEKVSVTFKNPQRAVTPGQACVFYDGEHMLGGGIIC